MKTILKTSALFLCMLLAFRCSKDGDNDSTPGTSRMMVSLGDAPGDYDNVFIDVDGIMITSSTSDNGWVNLSGAKTGIYDLLELTAGNDTLLLDTTIGSGRINQIRLLLGDSNSVVIDGVTYELETPSAQQSGLKININQDIVPGTTYQVLLDFDVSKSIVQTGSGKYILKPVIRAIINAAGGAISGNVAPASASSEVLAITGTDTVGTVTDSLGAFLIRGLTAGSYNVLIRPSTSSGFADTTITAVSVISGQTTNIGTITLQ